MSQGDHDGRLAGREDGMDIGRSQALIQSYLDGFQDGVARADRSRDADYRTRQEDDDGAAAGRRTGLEAGRVAGLERGDAGASEAYARLEGRPAFRRESVPQVAAPPPPASPACAAPATIALRLPRGRALDIDPARADDARWDPGLERPRAPLPQASLLRQEARREGFSTGDDVDAWVDGYRDAFSEAYEDIYEEERANAPWSERRRFEEDGREDGETEGLRRLACVAFGRGHERGHAEGFADGFERGFSEGWDAAAARHESGPVIVLESASLEDASDDGVLEPGEEVLANLVAANAGLVDAGPGWLSWSGIQSVDGQGDVREPLRAQSRRALLLAAGRVGAGAPLGASALVQVLPQRGTPRTLTALVQRPVTLDAVHAYLEAREGSLVRMVRVTLRSGASRPVDRGLVVGVDAASSEAGPIMPGTTRDLVIELPATGADLDAQLAGQARLAEAGVPWMTRAYSDATPMERAVSLAADLRSGGDEERLAMEALLRRLQREMNAALDDPKLYKRLGSQSELLRFAQARLALEPARAAALREGVVVPLLRLADLKSTPRRVRVAVREAFEMRR